MAREEGQRYRSTGFRDIRETGVTTHLSGQLYHATASGGGHLTCYDAK